MAALAHDGHFVTCAACRAPLRTALVTERELRLIDGDIVVGDIEDEQVECANCRVVLGSLETVRQLYKMAAVQ